MDMFGRLRAGEAENLRRPEHVRRLQRRVRKGEVDQGSVVIDDVDGACQAVEPILAEPESWLGQIAGARLDSFGDTVVPVDLEGRSRLLQADERFGLARSTNEAMDVGI